MIALFASFTLSRIRLARSNCALHVGVADGVERVLLHRDRLRERLAVDGQPRLIRARQRERTVGRRAPEHHARERRDRRVLQIPGEALHAGRHRRGRRTAAPAPAAFFLVGRRIRRSASAGASAAAAPLAPPAAPCRTCAPASAAPFRVRQRAVERPHHLTAAVENLERHLLRRLLQPVGDLRRIRRPRRVGRLEEIRVGRRRDRRAVLPQRRRRRRGCRSRGRAWRSRRRRPRPRCRAPACPAGPFFSGCQ